jgi:hypothetical protein
VFTARYGLDLTNRLSGPLRTTFLFFVKPVRLTGSTLDGVGINT